MGRFLGIDRGSRFQYVVTTRADRPLVASGSPTDNKLANRKEYLDYLGRLYDRANEEVKRTGVTKWVLLLAAGFGATSLASIEETLRSNSLEIPVLLSTLYLQHFLLFVVAAVFILDPTVGSRRATISAKWSHTPARDVYLALATCLPVSAPAIFVLMHPATTLASAVGPAFWIPETLFGLAGLIWIAITVTNHLELKKHGFPTPSSATSGKQDFVMDLVISGLSFSLGGYQLYEMFKGLNSVPSLFLPQVLHASGYVLLIFWSLFVLFNSRSRETRLAMIQAIESDAMLDNISEDEIVRRIR